MANYYPNRVPSGGMSRFPVDTRTLGLVPSISPEELAVAVSDPWSVPALGVEQVVPASLEEAGLNLVRGSVPDYYRLPRAAQAAVDIGIRLTFAEPLMVLNAADLARRFGQWLLRPPVQVGFSPPTTVPGNEVLIKDCGGDGAHWFYLQAEAQVDCGTFWSNYGANMDGPYPVDDMWKYSRITCDYLAGPLPPDGVYEWNTRNNYKQGAAVQVPGRTFLLDDDGNTFPNGYPHVLTPGRLASAVPALAPMLGGVQPAPLTRSMVIKLDKLAEGRDNPWLGREVGPSPSMQLSISQDAAKAIATSGRMGRRLRSRVERQLQAAGLPKQVVDDVVQGVSSPGPFAQPEVDSSTGTVRFPFDVFGGGPVVPFRRPPVGVKEKKLRVPLAIIHALAVATYAGAVVRDLHLYLPKKCRSYNPKKSKHYDPKKKHHQRYDSMLEDIYRCFDQIDWDRSLIKITEDFLKFGAEGFALSVLNRGRSVGGYGQGTALLHGSSTPTSDQTSDYGGAYANREGGPFAAVSAAQRWLNAQADIGL